MMRTIKPPYTVRERWQAAYRDWRRARWMLNPDQTPASAAIGTLRMAFGPVFGRVFPATFDRHAAAAAAAANWWEVAGKTCVAAYQPKGAASLAASYTNLANPGTYDAAPGTAPTWASGTGWTFNGSDQWLIGPTIGTPSSTTVIVSYANSPIGTDYGQPAKIGSAQDAYPNAGGPMCRRYNDNWRFSDSTNYAGHTASGTQAQSGVACYGNGSYLGDAGSAGSGTPVYVVGRLYSDVAYGYYSGDILAAAFYSDTLTAGEVEILAAAMAAL